MAYELRDGQGSLFQDSSERNKDYDGKCMIGGQMYWIAGWKKAGKDGKPPWLSLEFKPAERQRAEPRRREEIGGRGYAGDITDSGGRDFSDDPVF